jgi:hypothetical protein
MKKVVTVTLGSSKQDFEFKTEFLGQSFSVRRMGADNDTGKAWELMRRQQAWGRLVTTIRLACALWLTRKPSGC